MSTALGEQPPDRIKVYPQKTKYTTQLNQSGEAIRWHNLIVEPSINFNFFLGLVKNHSYFGIIFSGAWVIRTTYRPRVLRSHIDQAQRQLIMARALKMH